MKESRTAGSRTRDLFRHKFNAVIITLSIMLHTQVSHENIGCTHRWLTRKFAHLVVLFLTSLEMSAGRNGKLFAEISSSRSRFRCPRVNTSTGDKLLYDKSSFYKHQAFLIITVTNVNIRWLQNSLLTLWVKKTIPFLFSAKLCQTWLDFNDSFTVVTTNCLHTNYGTGFATSPTLCSCTTL